MTEIRIPFNKPHLTGREVHFFYDAAHSGKLSGNGKYTVMCQKWFESRYGFLKCLLTTSCTDALEMCAMLCGVGPGDEVIVPSYTFVSTALAFVRAGAKVVFADSSPDNPDMDASSLESLVTERTRVIVPVHYAGMACDMDAIMDVARRHSLIVVEDAAQAVESTYKGRPLGTIGHLSAFSFHETKNIMSGEGGMLGINDERFVRRAEIIWEKGTNRAEFFRGEVSKYNWVDIGSSFLPAESVSAMLWAQLECVDDIQARRRHIWDRYYELLAPLASSGRFTLPRIPEYAVNNASIFYLVCDSSYERDSLIALMKDAGVLAVSHYLPLHRSPYYGPCHDGRKLPNCDRYAGRLVRLPLYYDLQDGDVEYVTALIRAFFAGTVPLSDTFGE